MAVGALRQATADLGGPVPYVDRELGTLLAAWLRSVLRRHEARTPIAHQEWNSALDVAYYSARKRLPLSINIDSLTATPELTRANRATAQRRAIP